MARSRVLWSVTFLVPLLAGSFVFSGLAGAATGSFLSLATLGQVLVAALGVFAVWVGLADDGH